MQEEWSEIKREANELDRGVKFEKDKTKTSVFQRHRLNLPDPEGDLPSFATAIQSAVYNSLLDELNCRGPLKVQLVISPMFEKNNEADDDSKDYANPSMRSYQEIVMTPKDIPVKFDKALDKIESSIDSYTEMGSGWTISGISNAVLNVSTYAPILDSGSRYIPLPEWIARKKAVISVQNKGDDCFRWAVKSALFPVNKDSQRVSKYPTHEDDGLDFEGFTYPFKFRDIPEFEERNSLSIDVYYQDVYSIVGQQRV